MNTIKWAIPINVHFSLTIIPGELINEPPRDHTSYIEYRIEY